MKYLSGYTDPFSSPVTGLSAVFSSLERGYIWMGDENNNPLPSLKLLDLKIDVISLEQQVDVLTQSPFIVQSAVPFLPHAQALDKLPDGILNHQKGVIDSISLGAAVFPDPTGLLPNISIPNPSFNPLVPLDWIMSGPILGQILVGSSNMTATQWQTGISSSYALAQAKIAQLLKRFDLGGLVVQTRTIHYNWPNPAMALIPAALKSLYGLEDSYTFTNAQALDEMGSGLLWNDDQGNLSSAPLTHQHIWVGNAENKPVESLITIDEEGELYAHSLHVKNNISDPASIGFKAPPSLIVTTVWSLPSQDGLPGQFLSTDGFKNLSWQDVGGSGGDDCCTWIPDLTFILEKPDIRLPNAKAISTLSPQGISGVLRRNSDGTIGFSDDISELVKTASIALVTNLAATFVEDYLFAPVKEATNAVKATVDAIQIVSSAYSWVKGLASFLGLADALVSTSFVSDTKVFLTGDITGSGYIQPPKGFWASIFSSDQTINTTFSPSDDVSFNNNKIRKLADPSSSTDAATKGYVDGRSLSSFSSPTGNLDMGNYGITNLATPINAKDAVTKSYVDNHTWSASQITNLSSLPVSIFSKPVKNIDYSGYRLLNVGNPLSPNDAVTKNYVDTMTFWSQQIVDFISAVEQVSLDQLALPTNTLLLGGQRIMWMADPLDGWDAATKNYVDNKTWTSSQITDLSASISALRLDQLSKPVSQIDINNQKMINMATPTLDMDGANKTYVDNAISAFFASVVPGIDNMIRSKRLDQLQPPTSALNLNNQNIQNLASPINATDSATKGYVDNAVSSFVKAPSYSPTTTNVVLFADTTGKNLRQVNVSIDGGGSSTTLKTPYLVVDYAYQSDGIRMNYLGDSTVPVRLGNRSGTFTLNCPSQSVQPLLGTSYYYLPIMINDISWKLLLSP